MITKIKAITDTPQSPDPFFQVTQDTPLTTPSTDKLSNLHSELHELRTEIVTMKSFILKQSLLIKQNQKLVNKQSISDRENKVNLKNLYLTRLDTRGWKIVLKVISFQISFKGNLSVYIGHRTYRFCRHYAII